MDTQLIVQIAGVLVSLVAGVGVVPIVDWLKTTLNASGRWSQLLTVAVCTVVATVALMAEGQLAPEAVTAENAGIVFLAVLKASQAEYNRVRRKREKAPGG